MNAELKAKWVAALRSGEFNQARQTLVNANCTGFCCIGVGYLVITGAQPADLEGMGTEAASKSIGLTGWQEGELVSLNDFQDKSFEDIADYIEENL